MQSGPDVFDRELDPQPQIPGRADSASVLPFQRLLVNPFLAVLMCIIILALWREGYARGSRWLFQLGVGLTILVVFLVQYHCLDCGATGWLLRYRQHACPTVVSRMQRREWRRFRGPGVRLQLAGWLILVAGAVVLAIINWIGG